MAISKRKSLICPFCGDNYSREDYFEKHKQKCPDNPENGGSPDEIMNPALEIPDEMKIEEEYDSIRELEKKLALEKQALLEKRQREEEETLKKYQALRSAGYASPIEDSGSFRKVKAINIETVHEILQEQEKEGYGLVIYHVSINQVVYLFLKKNGK